MHALAQRGRGRPAGWALVAAAAILSGYTHLWFGGTDFASVALAVGYLLFVPIALLTTHRQHDNGETVAKARRHAPVSAASPPPYIAAAVVAVGVLALYVFSLAPTTAMWDTSEYIASARVLGIPHPPGNPVFVLLAHAFGLLPLPLSYAARINLLAAVTSAMASGLWFLVTDRMLQPWMSSQAARWSGAAGAAIIGATAFTVWNQSVVNEKVYTVALLGVAVVSWLALRWLDATTVTRADRLLLVMAYLCGVGYANHPAGLLPLPALAILIVMRRPVTLRRGRLLAGAAAAMALGLTPFLFQPIRSANVPVINGGAPTACRHGPQLGCTFSAETLSRLMANINREQYGGHKVAERQAPLGAQFGMWWMYFERQWLRDAHGQHATLQRALALLFLLLGLGGAVVHWQRDRATFWFVGPLIITLTVALVFYLNFRLAPMQQLDLGADVPREVRDRDYFYIWGFSAWGLWAGVGIAALWQRTARVMQSLMSGGTSALRVQPAARREQLAWMLSAPILLVALVPLFGNATTAPRRGQTFTREWAIDLLNSVEPYGILVTYGDNDSFPLWYAQEVEGVRRDVTLALAPYLGTDWYVRALLTRRPDAYDAARGPAAYRNDVWTRPVSPPLHLTADEADQIPPYMQLTTAQQFVHGHIVATIPPGYLSRDQFVVLRFIKDSFPARPVYFSVGNYAQALGLGPYLLSQGLAQRLMENPVENSATVIAFPGGHLDIARTQALWQGYGGPSALIAQHDWIDVPSVGIPSLYAATGQLLAAGLAARGDTVNADTVMKTVAAVARAAHLGN